MKRLSFFVITVWWAVVLASLLWSISHTRQQHEQFIHDTAQSIFNHIVLARRWNARHGGVYVPVTEESPPNPYLDIDDRDIRINDQLTLTKINPAYMTRQISELAEDTEGIQFRITSLNPIRPANEPTPLEREALLLFEEGESEFGRFLQHGELRDYFYMAPLITTSACLKCHESQGYAEGDVRGGISLILPNAKPSDVSGIIIGHILIGFVGTVIIIIFVQSLNDAYDQLREQSNIDSLTGLTNRRYFSDRFSEEFQRAYREDIPLTLILCDIDFFKHYNDNYGHLEGDRCLVKVANTISAQLRRPGDMCARYGGEEFIVLLPNTDSDGGMLVAEEIRQAVASIQLDLNAPTEDQIITLSMGVASRAEGDAEDPEQLIKRADNALYQAKAYGRNRVEFYHYGMVTDEQLGFEAT
jgi:diguanylate cyclase (GGDEF)-like protein